MYQQLVMEFENWKPVVGYEGLYDVSDQGRVRRSPLTGSYNAGQLLHTSKVRSGYWRVRLSKGGIAITYMVHGLVAAAFIGPRPEGYEVNHIDGDKANSKLSNLEIVTRSENRMHSMHVLGTIHKLKRGEENPHARLTANQVRAIRKAYAMGLCGQTELGRIYGVTGSAIYCIVHNKVWKHLLEAA